MSQAVRSGRCWLPDPGMGTIPALLMGDFNVGPGYVDDAYRAIASDSVRETGATLQPQAPLITWDPQNPLVKYGNYPNEPPAKIDHVFLSRRYQHAMGPPRLLVRQTEPVEGLSIVPGKARDPVPIPLVGSLRLPGRGSTCWRPGSRRRLHFDFSSITVPVESEEYLCSSAGNRPGPL